MKSGFTRWPSAALILSGFALVLGIAWLAAPAKAAAYLLPHALVWAVWALPILLLGAFTVRFRPDLRRFLLPLRQVYPAPKNIFLIPATYFQRMASLGISLLFADMAQARIMGAIFRDYNRNGIQNANEPFSGVMGNVYGSSRRHFGRFLKFTLVVLSPLMSVEAFSQCSITLVPTVSGCYLSGGQSKATVSVEVRWANAPVGGVINVTVDGTTKSITPGVISSNYGGGIFGNQTIASPQVLTYEINANGAVSQPVSAVFSNDATCNATASYNAPAACPDLTTCTGNQTGGQVFNDYNADGIKQAGEFVGVAGIQVTAYNNSGLVVASATTNSSGRYIFSSLTAGDYPLRIEFTNIPSYGSQGTVNGANGKTTVQFVNAPNCNVDLGILNPTSYCVDNPNVVLTCFVNGDPLPSGSSGGSFPALVGFTYNQSGTSGPMTNYGSASDVGAIWGLAYDRKRNKMYSSALVKRHVGLGTLGLGGLYVTDLTTNTTSPFLDLTTLSVNLGTIGTNSARGMSSSSPLSRDADGFLLVGKAGIGDIDISENSEILYFTNLNDNRLYALTLDSDNNPATLPTAADITSYDISSGISCTGGQLRIWATKVYEDRVYIGAICDASISQSASDLRAYVIEFNPTTNTSSVIFDFPLTYPKGYPGSGYPSITGWFPWTDSYSIFDDALATNANIIRPTPMFMDIEFDLDGSMVLGFGDRIAMQTGHENMDPRVGAPYENYRFSSIVGGDILRAGKNNGVFLLESNAQIFGQSGSAPGNNQGPGFGEFYNDDFFSGSGQRSHAELAQGSLALRPGSGQVVATTIDPVNGQANSGGVRYYNNSNGSLDHAFAVYISTNPPYYSNAKSASLGDVELVCGSITYLEIGNRVWNDTDRDGIQDPGENPIANVSIDLYTDPNGDGNPSDGTLIASTTTNGDGAWFFNSTSGLLPNTNYVAQVGSADWSAGVGAGDLNGFAPTLANVGGAGQPDVRDSDVSITAGIPRIAFSTGALGQNNHTLDMGFFLCIPPSAITLTPTPPTCTGSTTNNNGSITLSAVTNGTHYGVSTLNAGIYNGPTTIATATAIVGMPVVQGSIPNTGGAYIVRIFNGMDDCFVDEPVSVAPVSCGGTCSITLTPLVSGCYDSNGNSTGGNSVAIVQAIVDWQNAPSGQTINVSVTGATAQSINPVTSAKPAILNFEVPANGASITVTATFSTTTTCTATKNVTAPNGTCLLTPCQAGNTGGTVWRDLNGNGVKEATETTGVGGVTVKAYDCNGNLVATTTTDYQGQYTFTTLTFPNNYRLEFSNLPPQYKPTSNGTDGHTDVQFITAADCTIDFGVNNPVDYCQTATPDLTTTCFVVGTGGASDRVIVHFPYNSTGRFGTGGFSGPMAYYNSATPSVAGSVWGLAYKRDNKKLFSSALMKRHAAFGSGGTGGIYVTDVVTDATTLFATIPNTGTDPHDTDYSRDAVNGGNNPFDAVGKIGLGDLDISEDEQTLYVVNLNDKKIYPINTTTAAVGMGITIPNPNCTGGTNRPFGLGIHGTTLYAGVVCDADQTTDTADVRDLSASIYAYDLTTQTWQTNPVLQLPLNYIKGAGYEELPSYGGKSANRWWQGWTNSWVASNPQIIDGVNTYATHTMSNNRVAPELLDGYFLQFPQPILSDIEFDVKGNMILGFMDRLSHQIGASWDMNGTPNNTNIFFYTVTGGDILKASPIANGTTYVLEANGSVGGQTGAGVGNNEGLYGGEFYQDRRLASGNVKEFSFGALAVNLQKDELISTVVDAIGADANGFVWFNNSTGLQTNQYEPLNTLPFYDKAAALGEVALLCSPAPIQIGNYVWTDTDGDGRQDACEQGLSGVKVSLYNKTTNTFLAVTTTGANGEYYFTGTGTAGETWIANTGTNSTLQPNTQYTVVFGYDGQMAMSQFNTTYNQLTVGGVVYKITTANTGEGTNPDLNDSDAATMAVAGQPYTGYPLIMHTTSAAGSTDHSLDMGVFAAPQDYGDLPDTGVGTGANNYETQSANNGPSHFIASGIKIGTVAPDAETNGQQNAGANGDDNTGTPDDEDGWPAGAMLVAGQTTNVTIDVMNMTGGDAKLVVFIDFDGDGDFNGVNNATDEMFSATVANNATMAPLSIAVPANATLNANIGLRMRLSSDPTFIANMLPTGAANNGEVEDHLVQVMGYDWGDLADGNTTTNGAGNYATQNDGTTPGGANDGPSHKIISGLKLGATVDAEGNGQQSATANGDDTNDTDPGAGTDDENGVTLPSFVAGVPANITVNAMNMMAVPTAAKLFIFIDWNNDGDFSDTDEALPVVNVPDGTNGNLAPISVTPPASSVPNTPLGVRVRLSTDMAAMSPNGEAPDGEVEDYTATVTAFDYGDLPDSGAGTGANNYETQSANGGPVHTIVSGIKIGTVAPDAEANGQQNTGANGDDNTSSPDDEDGWPAGAMLVAGQTTNVTIDVMNMTGGDAKLVVFIDFDGDGDFNGVNGPTDEMFSATVANNATTVPLSIVVPANATLNANIGLRMRLSSDPTFIANMLPTGAANNGEVEDHLVQIMGYDWGDLADGNTATNGAGNYATQNDGATPGGSNDGPSHKITSGLKLGTTVDAEGNGQQSATANGDDANDTDPGPGTDDENGVTLPSFVAGVPANITVNAMNMMAVPTAAKLFIFIDWNNDGDFADTDEALPVVNVPDGTNGNLPPISVTPPVSSVANTLLGVRVRLSTDMAAMSPTGEAPNGEVEDYTATVTAFDYGDLPDNGAGTGTNNYETQSANGGPVHMIVSGIKIGTAAPDAEGNGQQNAGANGDDNASSPDDEDGWPAGAMLVAGQTTNVTIDVMNMTGGNAKLVVFIDFDGDGDFNGVNNATDEMFSATVANNAATVPLSIVVPANAALNANIGLRMRLSSDPAFIANMLPTGAANNGEVEDYLVQVMGYDWGDLADGNTATNGAGNYATQNDGATPSGANDGPSHKIISGLKLGATVDAESNGQQSATANGDDTNDTDLGAGTDDENGVTLPMFVAGVPANITVNAMNMMAVPTAAKLFIFIDWNNDGDFADTDEALPVVNVPDGTNGNLAPISVTPPLSSVANTPLGVRVRLSTDMAAMSPNGEAPNGEVEDYTATVTAFDYGDLPDSGAGAGANNYETQSANGGPVHTIVSGIKIGTVAPDAEGNGQQNAGANGDDNASSPDDEDGWPAGTMLVAGQTTNVTIDVMNTTGGDAKLVVFIDFDGDGDFNGVNNATDEMFSATVANNAATVPLSIVVPANATLNANIGLRMRLSSDPAFIANMLPTGAANNGEVEDHLVQVMGYDWGDLADGNTTTNGAGNYATQNDGTTPGGANDGPSHKIISGLKLGATVDAESNGQQSATANGDDTNDTDLGAGTDDENGVTLPMFVAGVPANITVNAMNMMAVPTAAKLFIFIDWNNDGDFADTDEALPVVNVPDGTNGNLAPISVTPPLSSVANTPLGVRVRLSTDMAAMSPNGEAPNGEVEDYTATVTAYDWGDLPDSGSGTGSNTNYQTNTADNGPRHAIFPGIKIGAVAPDVEADGQPNTGANGDDNTTAPDDEDGWPAGTMLVAGQTTNVTLDVMNMTGGNAKLVVFIDFDGDGDFGGVNNATDEMFSATVANNAATVPLSIAVPVNATLNTNIGLRMRLSSDPTFIANMLPTGVATDGEVEDHLVQVMGYDWGDLPDGNTGTTGTGNYATQNDGTTPSGANDGPSHKIISGLKLGASVDAEGNGQQNVSANGDDSTTPPATDDENGVTFPIFVTGTLANITVNVMNMMAVPTPAKLFVFIDWNNDGDFADMDEAIPVVNVPDGTNGNVNVQVTPPLTAILTAPLGVRVRLSTDMAAMSPNGEAPDGEVEDYIVMAEGYDYGDLNDNNAGGATAAFGTPADHQTRTADGGARHKILADAMGNAILKIGATVDDEMDGQPSADAGWTAGGDDMAGSPDDEDGLDYNALPQFIVTQTTTLQIPVMNMSGSDAKLVVYVDFDKSGTFGGSEMFSPVALVPTGTNGNVAVQILVPANAVVGDPVGLRIRLANNSAEAMSPTGLANTGEVEDYMVRIVGYDFGDLPDTYNTNGNDNPPKHIVTNSLKLGASVDAEIDGLPDPMAGSMGAANSDDGDAGLVTFGTSVPPGDDENGIMLTTPLVPGTTATIMVDAMNMTGSAAVLQGWIDWNGDGDFDLPDEALTFTNGGGGNVPSVTGLSGAKLTFNVPANATFAAGNAMARFRLSPLGGLSPSAQTDPVPFGEIEDYKFPLAKVGNLVWEDYDFDGEQDPGEPGINGVTVTVTWLGADGAVGGAGANADVNYAPLTTGPAGGFQTGEYYLCGLTAGTYKVTYATPTNMTPTRSNRGSQLNGGTRDSDGTVTGMDLTMAMETFTIANPAGLPTNENGTGDSAPGSVPAVNGFPDAQTDETHDQGFARLDYGDLPSGILFPGRNYKTTMEEVGPIHVILPNFKLGTAVNGNVNGAPGLNANGDVNDEDGVVFAPSVQLPPGGSFTIQVTAMNPTGAPAVIQGWFDWNDNGTFDAGEQIAPIAVPAAGLNAAPVTVPVPMTVSPTMCDLYARFRLSPTGGLNATGPDKDGVAVVPQGEVEDYKVLVAPLATCPPNIVLPNNIGICGASVTIPPPVPVVCPGWVVQQLQGLPSGAIYPVGTTVVEWKVTDATGFMSTCSFTVTVNDVEKPSITCPNNISKLTDPNMCGAVVNHAVKRVSDNCPGVTTSLTSGPASGTKLAPGAYTATYQATDAHLNTATCSFTITVADGQAPSIVCPANLTAATNANACVGTVTYPKPTATDNCVLPAGQPAHVSGGTGTIVNPTTATATFPTGITTVTWKATDGVGLTKTCSFRVIVYDTQAPAITCPTIAAVNTAPGTCSAVVTYANATAVDNCSVPVVARIKGPVSGSTFAAGTTRLIFRATDAAGRSATCSVLVTVVDNQTPAITCPGNIVATGSGVPCRAVVNYAPATATDNCDGVLSPFQVQGLASGSVFPAGTTTNIWRARAGNGQETDCSFTVTVNNCPTMLGGGTESREGLVAAGQVGLRLAPNPADDRAIAEVEGLGMDGGRLLLFDVAGRLVWEQKLPPVEAPQQIELPVGVLKQGAYQVVLRTSERIVAKPLIIVHR